MPAQILNNHTPNFLMGRRATGGRKYPKHISIQVLDQHNQDLKAMVKLLNESSQLPNSKKWTIRDVILTLFYANIKTDGQWFKNNHFEGLTKNKLTELREILNSQGPSIRSSPSPSREKKIHEPPKQKKPISRTLQRGERIRQLLGEVS